FFKDVQVKTVPVDGRDDLVDVNFKVEEEFSGSISASLGYADGSGVQLGANVKQNNFMGTGKKVEVGVNRSKYQESYNLGVTNPYYTKDGVSRGFNVYYKKRNLDEIDTLSSYNVDRLGASVSFGYPLSETQRVGLSLGYDKTDITTGVDVVQEIENDDGTGFVDVHGKEYGLFNVNASWRQSSLNRGRFATKGSSQRLSLEATVPGGDLEYYKATYKGQVLFPLGDDGFAIKARTKLGYGGSYGDTEKLPFFEHYYAGGFNSVRGFEQSSLGPKSTPKAGTGTVVANDADTFGGNLAVEAGTELIFPVPFLKDKRSIQTSLFVETGNVFDTECGETREAAGTCSDFDADELRSSVGLGINWNTVIGPLSFSLSKPLQHDKENDETKRFQFSIGTGF
ncbi:MAG: outer membrane protein assembly factor BamA, partial [Pseudomonadota bacterium]